MKRKDTILIGVIVNAALLGVLFTTAIIYDPDQVVDRSEATTSFVEAAPLPPKEEPRQVSSSIALNIAGDEVDQILSYEVNAPIEEDVYLNEVAQAPVEEPTIEKPKVAVQSTPKKDKKVGEVKVKKGDSLDKIAKVNNTSVKAIKELNQLKNDKLSIGQTLKMPLKNESIVQNEPVVVETKAVEAEPTAEYYVVKSGDNPWKIAKKFNTTSEEIMRLNSMDEKKAKNLKAGDRIRVK